MNLFMSMKFKGKILDEFVEPVYDANIVGNWHGSQETMFDIIKTKWVAEPRVPFKPLIFPEKWLGSIGEGETCTAVLDRANGIWEFAFTTASEEEFNTFMYDLLPFIIEKVYLCEVWVEKVTPMSNYKQTGVVTSYKLKDHVWEIKDMKRFETKNKRA